MEIIGKIAATEKNPTTIDEFYFWTTKDRVLNPFDVVTVNHIENSKIYGVIEEISHITDTPSYLTSFISCDFGDVNCGLNTQRIGMNFVKARVVGNTKSIYTPALDGSDVMFSTIEEIQEALGLDDVKNKLVCGYLEMYENNEKNKQTLPVHFNSHFLIGPEGAHLNISGISGLASKTSYAMFLLKAIQDKFMNNPDEDDVAFVLLNVKGRDLLAIDEPNLDLEESQKEKYSMLGLDTSPFKNVKYFYPYSSDNSNSYHRKDDIEEQKKDNKAFLYKYLYDEDKGSLDMLFANIDDPTQTMDSINNFVVSEQGKFGQIRSWTDFQMEVGEYCKAGANKGDKEITVSSWRKYKRVVGKALSNEIFGKATSEKNKEVRLRDSIADIKKNDIYVIDVARLDETMQGFVFGDVIRAVYDLKLGIDGVDEDKIPSRIIIFIDELNKYASSDVPRNSPILRQIIDITERGRSLGIVLFSAEQFKSAIHDRVKGNCSTHAYGRTNAIEISKNDYRYVPHVFKNMMTRLKQGEYIVQNPVFRSLLNVKFPKPLYKQFK
jgi:DNA helicase HerA-like ATPase